MGSLSNVEASLPPGFRFHPRDEELICDYLVRWMSDCPLPFPSLIEVDLNKCEPWDIPESACVGGKEWYFYSQRDRKYATGLRTNRATISGYWKATGKDRPITQKGTLVGMRKTLVFYQGRAPKGRKTDWVMHEFRVHGHHGPKFTPPVKGDWVLCRVLFKSRADTRQGKGEDAQDATSSMEPPYMSFEQGDQGEVCISASANDHHYHQQVPCFSIFSPMDPPPPPPHITPNKTNFGFYDENEHKTMKGILNYLTKTENNDLMTMMMMKMKGCSPNSLGEGSSECSYLSDVGGLSSSVWNHY